MANAFSNPQFYQQFKPVQTEDWNTAIQLASFKRQEFDRSQAELEQWMGAIASTPIDNVEAKAHFENNIKTVLSEVERTTTADSLSKKGTREKILSTIGGAIDDVTINAIGASRQYRNYQAQWEALKKQKAEFYSDDNYAYGMAGYKDYVNASKDANVSDYVRNGFKVIPYVDVEGNISKTTMEIIKQKGKREFSVDITDENGVVIGQRQMVETGLTNDELRKVIYSSFTDPNSIAQMQVNAWKSYGGYSEEGVQKLVQDYAQFNDSTLNALESERNLLNSRMESETNEALKESYKNQIGGIDKTILEMKTNSPLILEKIKNGQYVDASMNLVGERLIQGQMSKFSTLYSTYQTGVKADEMFWKMQDYNLDLAKFNYQQSKDAQELTLEREKISLQREANGIASGTVAGADGIQEIRDVTEFGEIDPYQIATENLIETNNLRKDLIKEFAVNVDENLVDGRTINKKEATNLKNLYIDQIYGAVKRRTGKEVNKDYMKSLSIQEIMNGYDKDGNTLFAVARRNKGAISNLALATGDDQIMKIQNQEDVYKSHSKVKQEMDTAYTKSLEKNIFTKDFLKVVMSEETNVLSNGKVQKAKDAYKNILNPDGSFRSGVSQAQKNKVIQELNKTYEVQNSGLENTPVDGNRTVRRGRIEKYVMAIGGKKEDIVIDTTPNRSGTISYTLKKGSETEKLAKQAKGLLHNNYLFGANTNLAKDNVFSEQFEKGKKLALVERDQIAKKYAETELFTNKKFLIPTEVSGKESAMGIGLARLINERSGGLVVEAKDVSTIGLVENKDGSFTATFNTKIKGEDGKDVASRVPVRIERDDISRSVPQLAERLNLNVNQQKPVYTYNVQGLKPIKVGISPYLLNNDSTKLKAYAKGDPVIASNITLTGATQTIVDKVPLAFQMFEGFEKNVKNKLSIIHNDYDVEVAYNSGGTDARITMVRKKTGEEIVSVDKPLVNGSIDAYKNQAEKTSGMLLNELISKVIYDNIYFSNKTYDNPNFVELFGVQTIKE